MQIKSKFIAPDAVDGSKIKLKKDEALRGTKQDGTEVELVKLNGEDKVLLKGSEAAFKSDVTAEQTRAQAAESALQAEIDAEESARAAAVSAEQSARQSADAVLQGNIDAEAAARVAGDAATLTSAQAYADAKVAALVNSAPAVLDTLKELSDALGSDPNFATTVAGQIAAVQTEVDAVETDVASHESRLDVMDIIDNTEQLTVFENSAATYADGFAGSQDPSHREGWYFKNAAQGQKVNWYFFDGQTENISLGNFSCYAIVTFDSLVSKPHLAFYTVPGASGNAASWYRSRLVYTPAGTPVAGKKYLMYVGQDPKVHPELPRLQMEKQFNSAGPQANDERVLTAVLGSDSGTSANNCQFVAEAIGVYSPSIKRKISLKIRKLSQASFEALASKQEKFTITSGIISAGSVTLAHKTLMPGSVVAHIGRLGLFAGEDFTISTNGSGYPVLTFAGDILPGGTLALEANDVLRVQYLVK